MLFQLFRTCSYNFSLLDLKAHHALIAMELRWALCAHATIQPVQMLLLEYTACTVQQEIKCPHYGNPVRAYRLTPLLCLKDIAG